MSKNKKYSKTTNSTTEISAGHSIKWIRILITVLVLFIYGQTVNFEFTLDDDLFYVKHRSVQEGFSGVSDIFTKGSLNGFDGTTGVQPYRPVTLTVFAIQKQFFDNSPYAAHTVNLILYVLTLQVLISLLIRLFPEWHKWMIAFVALLFALHPIHTEVVSSVKSMDELLAALFGFLAWNSFLSDKKEGKLSVIDMATGAGWFFLALLSKESAIAFLVIIPLSRVMLKNVGVKGSLLFAILLLVPTVLFLIMRSAAMGEASVMNTPTMLDNVLYASTSFSQTIATKFVILFHYIRLMLLPWPLNWDYSYNQIPLASWSSILPWFGLIVYSSLFVFAVLNFRKQALFSFCIFLFLLASAPTNNFFFINGATVAERFLFVPSLSLAIALPVLLSRFTGTDMIEFNGSRKTIFISILSIVLLVFSALSMIRSSDWKTNLSLFEKGVLRSPNSSRTHYSLATEYMTLGRNSEDVNERTDYLNKAITSFAKSLSIYPENKLSHYNSGICLSMLGDTVNAIAAYKKAIQIDSNYLTSVNNLGVIYQALHAYDSSEQCYMHALRVDPAATLPKKNLGDLYIMKGITLSQQGHDDEALQSYKTSLQYNSANLILLNNIASIYSSVKKFDSALIYLNMGLAADPGNLMIVENLAAVYYLNGNYTQAITLANRALAIKPNSRKSYGVLMDTYNAMGNSKEGERYKKLYESSPR